MKTYDISKVEVTLNGIPLQGISEDDLIFELVSYKTQTIKYKWLDVLWEAMEQQTTCTVSGIDMYIQRIEPSQTLGGYLDVRFCSQKRKD